jgi:UDP-glucose 4-epimerase
MRVPVRESSRRSGDPPALVAASAKIRDELGWVPEKPEIDTMIADAWRFLQLHPFGYG